MNYADVPILPNLEVFASYDPVAIDKTCLDKTVEAAEVQGSTADELDVLDAGKRKSESCSAMMAGLVSANPEWGESAVRCGQGGGSQRASV